ncbi:hypothetical protein QUB60_00365 [Microcoleus sp. A2-C5]|uniref:hypothetical protein n=1 Tax=unclassified Microcoleus TaxID=2642155 RepID=UPI002FD1B9F4
MDNSVRPNLRYCMIKKREEGRRKKEEGRRKKEEGRRKKEEGKHRHSLYLLHSLVITGKYLRLSVFICLVSAVDLLI